MKQKVEQLLRELKKENDARTDKMESNTVTEHYFSVLVHEYNAIIKVINKVEAILKD